MDQASNQPAINQHQTYTCIDGDHNCNRQLQVVINATADVIRLVMVSVTARCMCCGIQI